MKLKIPALLAISSFLFVGSCSADSRLNLVKNGVFDFCPQKTVKQMVNGYIANPKWEAFVATDGEDYVNVTGQISYFDKPVDMLLQFQVNTDSERFEVNAFEMDGVPQNYFMSDSLLENMCYGD